MNYETMKRAGLTGDPDGMKDHNYKAEWELELKYRLAAEATIAELEIHVEDCSLRNEKDADTIAELTAALDEICRLTAPGGFPSYKHLHTITLKTMDAVAALKDKA